MFIPLCRKSGSLNGIQMNPKKKKHASLNAGCGDGEAAECGGGGWPSEPGFCKDQHGQG